MLNLINLTDFSYLALYSMYRILVKRHYEGITINIDLQEINQLMLNEIIRIEILLMYILNQIILKNT